MRYTLSVDMLVIAYIHHFWQPIVDLIIGSAILSFIGYINWYGDIKPKTAEWIKKAIFDGEIGSAASADSLFMNVSVILLLIGLLWTGLALGYLFH
jgi:hypothetical protein